MEALGDETTQDAALFNQLAGQRNKAWTELNAASGFSVQSKKEGKPNQSHPLQLRLAALEANLSKVYFDLQDDLAYLNEDTGLIRQVFLTYAGRPPVEPPFAMNPAAFFQGQDHVFRQGKDDLNLLPELEILYQELRMYHHLVSRLVASEMPSKDTMQAIRFARQNLGHHANYISERAEDLDRGNPEIIGRINADLSQKLQEVDAILARSDLDDPVGDFSIQQTVPNQTRFELEQMRQHLEKAYRATSSAEKQAELLKAREFARTSSLVRRVSVNMTRGKVIAILYVLGVAASTQSQVVELRYCPACDPNGNLNKDLDGINKNLIVVMALAEALINKIFTDQCVKNADPAALASVLQWMFGPGGNGTGAIHVVENSYDRLLVALNGANYLDEQDQKNIGGMIETVMSAQNRFISEGNAQQRKLEEDCKENECEEEVKAISDYYMAMPLNIYIENPHPNLDSILVPSYKNKLKDINYFLYDEVKSIRSDQYRAELPLEINFMAHSLGGHGGTAPDYFLKLYPSKSRFNADKELFYYTLEAYKHSKSAKMEESTLNAGRIIGLTSVGKLKDGLTLLPVSNYKYSIKNCKLITIFPTP
ncbi:MAG: hypothetical protein CVV27_01515 [Candidatus Melainabacteria bacterium HGW-Melainabacteria-1]|nr:MAG: hypothetical protein CVV27_01515 [Candidatus Melainabacteria bacterium HGW-Melainabacteria-1]